jgi:phenylalanyl-tRNA synthetase beta chain
MMEALGRLEIKCVPCEEGFMAYPPTNRLDLLVEADIVEEIARIYGYDRIENTLPRDSEWGGKTEGQKAEDRTKDILTGMGLNEVLTYSFVSPKTLDMINLPAESEERKVMKLMNPLGEEYSIMRRSMVPNMMDVIKRNYNRKKETFGAFELGNTFIPKEIPVTQLPTEKKSLVMAMYGKGNDFFALKGVLSGYLDSMGVEDCEFVPEKELKLYHPGRTAAILVKGLVMGYIGEIHPDVMDKYGLDIRVCLAEVDYELLQNSFDIEKFYSPIPKYPAIPRDIAVKVDKEVYIRQIEEIIKKNGGELLTGVRLFDVYEGKQIEPGKKSVAYALVFQSTERTLKDEEVNLCFGNIVRALEIELKAELRK